MNTVIPASHRDLIDGPVLISFATIMPDGQPHLSVIWCNSDGDHVLINTIRGRQKEKNMARDPRVTILAVDPNDPYRSIEIRGEVIEMSEEGGIDHIDELTRIYTDDPGFYGYFVSAERKLLETRVICRIQPKRVRTEG